VVLDELQKQLLA
jgi:hypothetical protein